MHDCAPLSCPSKNGDKRWGDQHPILDIEIDMRKTGLLLPPTKKCMYYDHMRARKENFERL